MTPHFSSFPQITQPKLNPTVDFFLTPPTQTPPGSPWCTSSLIAMNNKPSLFWTKFVHRSVPGGLWLEDVDFGMISWQPAGSPSPRRTPPFFSPSSKHHSLHSTSLLPQLSQAPTCPVLQTPCTPSCDSHCLSWQVSHKRIESYCKPSEECLTTLPVLNLAADETDQ